MPEEIDFRTLEKMILNEVTNPYDLIMKAGKKYKIKEAEEKERDPLELKHNRDIFKESLYEAIRENKDSGTKKE
ncbi:MAG TPA: hypothetical protein VJC03_01055 [bacterium]|nr:hypothetical protein [bacterium]